jgi:hypothetical protein
LLSVQVHYGGVFNNPLQNELKGFHKTEDPRTTWKPIKMASLAFFLNSFRILSLSIQLLRRERKPHTAKDTNSSGVISPKLRFTLLLSRYTSF